MGHKISLDIDHVLVLIRHAITTGRPETALPLIDDVREGLAKQKEGEEASAKECDDGPVQQSA